MERFPHRFTLCLYLYTVIADPRLYVQEGADSVEWQCFNSEQDTDEEEPEKYVQFKILYVHESLIPQKRHLQGVIKCKYCGYTYIKEYDCDKHMEDGHSDL